MESLHLKNRKDKKEVEKMFEDAVKAYWTYEMSKGWHEDAELLDECLRKYNGLAYEIEQLVKEGEGTVEFFIREAAMDNMGE